MVSDPYRWKKKMASTKQIPYWYRCEREDNRLVSGLDRFRYSDLPTEIRLRICEEVVKDVSKESQETLKLKRSRFLRNRKHKRQVRGVMQWHTNSMLLVSKAAHDDYADRLYEKARLPTFDLFTQNRKTGVIYDWFTPLTDSHVKHISFQVKGRLLTEFRDNVLWDVWQYLSRGLPQRLAAMVSLRTVTVFLNKELNPLPEEFCSSSIRRKNESQVMRLEEVKGSFVQMVNKMKGLLVMTIYEDGAASQHRRKSSESKVYVESLTCNLHSGDCDQGCELKRGSLKIS